MPGYQSIMPPSVAGDDIENIVDCLAGECPDGAILVGWSLGGMIAIELAARMTNKVGALILLSSTPCFVQKPDWPHGTDEKQLLAVLQKLKKDKHGALNNFIAEVAYGDVSPRTTIRILREIVAKNMASDEVLTGGLEILRHQDLRGSLLNVRCPTGIISGMNDHLVAKTTGKAMQSLRPEMHLIEIDNAGHAPFISQQKKTAWAINRLSEKFSCTG